MTIKVEIKYLLFVGKNMNNQKYVHIHELIQKKSVHSLFCQEKKKQVTSLSRRYMEYLQSADTPFCLNNR